METKNIISEIKNGKFDVVFEDVYVGVENVTYQKKRYAKAVGDFIEAFGDGNVRIYSAPGRSEICGNHTDHQHGEILAASVNVDTIAVVKKTDDKKITIISQGYLPFSFSLEGTRPLAEENGTTLALAKGVVAGFVRNGHTVGGLSAYVTSDVLTGAGLSSSAAFETLIGTILSDLYNEGIVSPEEIAAIGQFAENVFFGKPCGLMDQMACAVGSVVHVDFSVPDRPKVQKIPFDLDKFGYSLCITDTKGSHEDLTHEYATIPLEMKKVANIFGKDFLLGLSASDLLENVSEIRKSAGDRGFLRALHFIRENERVKSALDCILRDDFNGFLDIVTASGNSSYKYLQNIYSNSCPERQNVSLALAVSEDFLGKNGACRVHGGGFAGTIQAFVKNSFVSEYQTTMNRLFGDGACHVLKIRKYGSIRIL